MSLESPLIITHKPSTKNRTLKVQLVDQNRRIKHGGRKSRQVEIGDWLITNENRTNPFAIQPRPVSFSRLSNFGLIPPLLHPFRLTRPDVSSNHQDRHIGSLADDLRQRTAGLLEGNSLALLDYIAYKWIPDLRRRQAEEDQAKISDRQRAKLSKRSRYPQDQGFTQSLFSFEQEKLLDAQVSPPTTSELINALTDYRQNDDYWQKFIPGAIRFFGALKLANAKIGPKDYPTSFDQMFIFSIAPKYSPDQRTYVVGKYDQEVIRAKHPSEILEAKLKTLEFNAHNGVQLGIQALAALISSLHSWDFIKMRSSPELTPRLMLYDWFDGFRLQMQPMNLEESLNYLATSLWFIGQSGILSSHQHPPASYKLFDDQAYQTGQDQVSYQGKFYSPKQCEEIAWKNLEDFNISYAVSLHPSPVSDQDVDMILKKWYRHRQDS